MSDIHSLLKHLANITLWNEPLPDWANERQANENGLYGGKDYDQEQTDTLEMFVYEARRLLDE